MSTTKLRLLSILVSSLALSLAACGDDDEGTPADAAAADAPMADAVPLPPDAAPPDAAPPDAPPVMMADAAPIDLSCVGAPSPTTAPDPLTIGGSVQDIQTMAGVPGATVEARLRADDTVVAWTTTDPMGQFSMMVATGGVPADGYLKISGVTGRVPTYVYPPDPLAADAPNLNGIPMLTESQRALLGALLGSLMGGEGIIGLGVVDCSGSPVQGAVVTFKQGGANVGTVAYIDPATGFPSTSAPGTGPDGFAIGWKIPVGDIEVNATVGGVTFEAHVVKVYNQEFTLSAIHP